LSNFVVNPYSFGVAEVDLTVNLANISGMTISLSNTKATTANTGVDQCSDQNSITASAYLVYKLNGTIIHTSTAINSGTFYGRYMSQGTSGIAATATATNLKYTWTLNTDPSGSGGDGYYGLNSGTASDWGDVVGFYADRGVIQTGTGILEGAGNYPGTSLGSNHTLVSGDVLSIEYA